MRQRVKIALAVVLAAGIAAGCGSDDDSANGGGSGGSDTSESSAKAAKPAKLKPTSARGQMVKCMDRAGFDVTHEDQDEATATNYIVQGDKAGSKKAVIIIHSNKDDSKRAAIKAGETKGLNAVPFGRAEFIRYDATDREAGVLANCVAESYVH